MPAQTTTEPSLVRAAIYARVSSDQQNQQGTIDSQVADLRQRVQADGLTLDDELCFIDDGYTGSTLVRPAATPSAPTCRPPASIPAPPWPPCDTAESN